MLHIRTGDLPTIELFIVIEHFANLILIGKAFIDKHILASLPESQKLTVRKPTPATTVKHHYMPAVAVLTKHHQRADKNHFKAKSNHESTIKHLNAVSVDKQKFFEPLTVMPVRVTTR